MLIEGSVFGASVPIVDRKKQVIADGGTSEGITDHFQNPTRYARWPLSLLPVLVPVR